MAQQAGERRPPRTSAADSLSSPPELRHPILDAIPHVVWTATADGSTTSINRRGIELIGITADQVHGWNWLDLLHPDDVDRSRERWQAAVDTGAPYVNEYRLRQSDGSYRWYLAHAVPLRAPGDHASGWLGTWTDIDDRRRAEDALRASEERFRQIADSISEVFWLTTLDKHAIDYVSPGYEAIWGRPRDALYASPQSWIDAIHVEDRARVARAASNQQAGGYDEEYRIVRPDGTERWIRDRAFPVVDAAGAVIRVAGVAEDITARKQSEEQLRTTTEQLRALSVRLATAREEEGRRIARELHDELGGSLSAIKWDLERLAGGLDQTPGPDLAALRQRLDLLAGTVRATGETVRRIASELRPAMLDDLGLVDAIEWHANEFVRRTGITCQVHRVGTVVDLSPSVSIEIFRIFQEALTNILRHAGATVVEVGVTAGADVFELTVRDDGVGMMPVDGARAGLGIVGMRERAALIGATLDVTSHPERGTAIRLRTPLGGSRPVAT